MTTFKKKLKGQVISDKMEKTVVVEVQSFSIHPLYKKRMRKNKHFKAENNLGAKKGQTVLIEEERPKSHEKCWRIVEIISKENKKS